MKLQTDWMFFGAEARLFIGGPAAYFVALSKMVDRELAKAGGIKPFTYECESCGFGAFKLHAEEIGKALRTDAQRALVKVRATQRKPQGRPTSRRRGRSA